MHVLPVGKTCFFVGFSYDIIKKSPDTPWKNKKMNKKVR